MLFATLLLIAQAGIASPLGECLPPDSAYVAAWYAEPEPGDYGRAHSGVIAGRLRLQTDLSELSRSLGTFRVIRTRFWREPPSRHDTLYFRLRSPVRSDAALYGKDIRGFVIGAMSSSLSGLQRADSSTLLVGEATQIGLLFSVGAPGVVEDGDGFRVTSIDTLGFRGWWDGGPSITPESLAWFCASRVD